MHCVPRVNLLREEGGEMRGLRFSRMRCGL